MRPCTGLIYFVCRWDGGIRVTFRDPASQSDNHSLSVTSPCDAPLARLTPNAHSGVRIPTNQRRSKKPQILRTSDYLLGWDGGVSAKASFACSFWQK